MYLFSISFHNLTHFMSIWIPDWNLQKFNCLRLCSDCHDSCIHFFFYLVVLNFKTLKIYAKYSFCFQKQFSVVIINLLKTDTQYGYQKGEHLSLITYLNFNPT